MRGNCVPVPDRPNAASRGPRRGGKVHCFLCGSDYSMIGDNLTHFITSQKGERTWAHGTFRCQGGNRDRFECSKVPLGCEDIKECVHVQGKFSTP